MRRIVRSIVLVVIILAFVVPPVLLVCGVLPYKVYVIHTGSMSPTIPSKSAVVVHERSYRIGQVVTYRTANGVVTHRLIGKDAGGALRTKGDANRTADPSTISRSSVIGGVVAAPRMVGYWLVYFKNPAGLASLFLAVICAWLVYSLPTDLAVARTGRGPKRLLVKDIPEPVPATKAQSRAPKATPPQTPAGTQAAVILKCSRCGVTFLTGDELKEHRREFDRNVGSKTRRVAPGSKAATDYLPRSLWQRAT